MALPLAALFNVSVHPTVLKQNNLLFSADFVGYARNHLQSLLGRHLQLLYFNGAQGDVVPLPSNETNQFEACEILGHTLAEPSLLRKTIMMYRSFTRNPSKIPPLNRALDSNRFFADRTFTKNERDQENPC